MRTIHFSHLDRQSMKRQRRFRQAALLSFIVCLAGCPSGCCFYLGNSIESQCQILDESLVFSVVVAVVFLQQQFVTCSSVCEQMCLTTCKRCLWPGCRLVVRSVGGLAGWDEPMFVIETGEVGRGYDLIVVVVVIPFVALHRSPIHNGLQTPQTKESQRNQRREREGEREEISRKRNLRFFKKDFQN